MYICLCARTVYMHMSTDNNYYRCIYIYIYIYISIYIYTCIYFHILSYSGWIASLFSNIISFIGSFFLRAEVSSPTWGDDEHPFTWSQVNSKVDGCSWADIISWYPRSTILSNLWKLLLAQLICGHPTSQAAFLCESHIKTHSPFSMASPPSSK